MTVNIAAIKMTNSKNAAKLSIEIAPAKATPFCPRIPRAKYERHAQRRERDQAQPFAFAVVDVHPGQQHDDRRHRDDDHRQDWQPDEINRGEVERTHRAAAAISGSWVDAGSRAANRFGWMFSIQLSLGEISAREHRMSPTVPFG